MRYYDIGSRNNEIVSHYYEKAIENYEILSHYYESYSELWDSISLLWDSKSKSRYLILMTDRIRMVFSQWWNGPPYFAVFPISSSLKLSDNSSKHCHLKQCYCYSVCFRDVAKHSPRVWVEMCLRLRKLKQVRWGLDVSHCSRHTLFD